MIKHHSPVEVIVIKPVDALLHLDREEHGGHLTETEVILYCPQDCLAIVWVGGQLVDKCMGSTVPISWCPQLSLAPPWLDDPLI